MRLVSASLLTLVLAAPAAVAAPVSDLFQVTGSAFSDITGGGASAPADPASVTFGVTFDPAQGDVFDQLTGITLVASDLAIDGGLGFSYDSASDTLTVGGAGLNGAGIAAGTNDVLLVVDDVSSTPVFDTFFYATASSGGLFAASSGSATLPEPASLGLLAAFAGLAGLVRRGRAA